MRWKTTSIYFLVNIDNLVVLTIHLIYSTPWRVIPKNCLSTLGHYKKKCAMPSILWRTSRQEILIWARQEQELDLLSIRNNEINNNKLDLQKHHTWHTRKFWKHLSLRPRWLKLPSLFVAWFFWTFQKIWSIGLSKSFMITISPIDLFIWKKELFWVPVHPFGVFCWDKNSPQITIII